MLPKISFASDGQMVHQDSFNQSTDTVQGNGVVGQFLGNGFYGIAKTMSFWSIVVATQTGDHNINYGIYECSDSNCATPIRWQQNLLYDTSGQGIGTAYKNTITLPVAWTLNPNMYYLLVATSNVANHIQFEGTSGDTYAGGICGVFSGGVSYCGSAVDLKFELWGSNVLQLSQVFNIYPTTGSTTPTNLVNWGFSYTDAPSDGITDYQVTFYALGASGKFPVASSTLTITGTPTYGTHDVTGSIYLIAGQQYRMNATLFGSFLGSNNSPLSFPGTATTFWVSTNRAVNPNGGSTGGDVSLIPECDAPASWLDVGTGISWAFCKMFYPSQSVMDQWYDIPNLMQAREPFSFFLRHCRFSKQFHSNSSRLSKCPVYNRYKQCTF